MHLTVPGCPMVVCSAGSIVLIPPMLDQIVGADGDAGLVLLAADRAGPLENGMTRYSATRSGDGDLRFVCGLISANISGSFGLLNRISRPIIAKLDDRAIVRASFQLMLKESAKPELRDVAVRQLFGGKALKVPFFTLIQRAASTRWR